MNYRLIMNEMIEQARGRVLECYTERHHIIPRCMGGTDDADNLVDLTAREHYIVHQLLVKIYPGNHKILLAARMMTVDRHGKRVNNRLYEWLKKKHSDSMKGNTINIGRTPWNKGIAYLGTGKDHPLWGKKRSKENIAKSVAGRAGFKHSEESKRTMSESHKGHKSWSKGLTLSPHSEEAKEKMRKRALNRKKATCPHCDKSGDPGPMSRHHFNNCKKVRA